MVCISDFIEQSTEKMQSYLRSLAAQIMPMRGDHPCAGKFIYYPLTVKRLYPDIHTVYGESIDAYVKRCGTAIRIADEHDAGKRAIRAVVTAGVGCGKTFFSAKLCHACLLSDKEFFSSCVELMNGENEYVPLLIRFSGIDSDSLYEGGFLDILYRLAVSFSRNQLSPEDFKTLWSELCSQGRALLIIDGLDELSPDELDDFWIRMGLFLTDYPLTNVIATSRNTVYDDGFVPYTISRIQFREQFVRFGKIWLDRYYEDEPKRAADAERIVNQNILNIDTLFSGVPEYFNFRLSYVTANSSFYYYELQKGLVELAMKRYTARRNKILYEEDIRLLLGYLSTIGCFVNNTSFSREALEGLIETAYTDLRGSLSAEYEIQTAIKALVQNAFLVKNGREYAINFDRTVIQYLCAEALVNGFVPQDICEDYESYLIGAYSELPEVAVYAAHLDHHFGSKFFGTLLEQTAEPDSEEDYQRRAILSQILCADRNPVTDRQLVRYCDDELCRNDLMNVYFIVTILYQSPHSMLRPIIEKRFREQLRCGETGFCFAFAACLVIERNGIGFRYDAVDPVDQYLDDNDDAAALALIRLAAAERLHFEENVYAQMYGIDFSKSVLSPRAVGFLNGLTENGFCSRDLLAGAVSDSLAAGLVSRRDFTLDNNRLAQLLEQGRDSLYEALLAYTDVITEPVTTACSQTVAQRYGELFRDSRKRDDLLFNTDNIITTYRYFKIYAALGCADRADTFRYSELLSEELRSPLVQMALPKDRTTLFDTDTVIKSLETDNGVYRLALLFRELDNPYIEDLSKETDPLRKKALTALLLIRGVIQRVYYDEDGEPIEQDIPTLLEEGICSGDNLSVIISVLADMTKRYPALQIIRDDRLVDEGSRRIQSILDRSSVSRRPLEKETVDFWLNSYFGEADAYAALLLMKKAYPEFGELIRLNEDDVLNLMVGLTVFSLDRYSCFDYADRLGIPTEAEPDEPSEDDSENADYIIFENKKYVIYLTKWESDGVTYHAVRDPGEKPVTMKNGKTVNNIFVLKYSSYERNQQITAPLSTEEAEKLFASMFNLMEN